MCALCICPNNHVIDQGNRNKEEGGVILVVAQGENYAY